MQNFDFYNFIYAILVSMILISCSRSGNNPNVSRSEDAGFKIVPAQIDELQSAIEAESKSLIFITTDWCRGGALTLNSYIFPQLTKWDDQNYKYYVIYLGKDLREDVVPNSFEKGQMITIYHVSNSLLNNAFVHKYRINSFLRELDPSYEFSNAIPVTVFYSEGELKKIRPSEIDSVLKVQI